MVQCPHTLGRPSLEKGFLPLAAFEDVALLTPSAFYRRLRWPFATVDTDPTAGDLPLPGVLKLLRAPESWCPVGSDPDCWVPHPKSENLHFLSNKFPGAAAGTTFIEPPAQWLILSWGFCHPPTGH